MSTTVEPHLLDEEVIAELESLDALILSDLLALYVREAAMHLDALSDALDRDDAAALSCVAHKLKGSSGALGAALVAETALALETAVDSGAGSPADLIDSLRHALELTDDAWRARAEATR